MEWKVPVNREGKFMSVHKPRLVYGGEGKTGRKGCYLKDIERQREKIGKSKVIEENGGVSSPTSMTWSRQGLVEGGGNRSNVSKTIEKQGLEGGVGNCTYV